MATNTEPAPPVVSRWKGNLAHLRTVVLTVLVTLAGAYLFYHYRTIPGPRLAAEGAPSGKVFRNDYQLTEDWFSENIPIWEKAMAPYKGKPGLQFLEVGVWEGRSCMWMLENVLTDPSARVTVIDPFEDGPVKPRFQANVKLAGAEDKVTTITGFSQIELRKLPLASFDIVYIDGSHRAADVLEDAILSWRLVKENGILIFDDYKWSMAQFDDSIRPKPAIDTFYRFYGKHFEVVHSSYQVIFRKKSQNTGAP